MIGKLDRRITIIQPVLTTGTSYEDKITSWELIDSVPEVWAKKVETKGNTLVQSDRVVFSQTITWTIRYRTDLNVRMRVVDQNSQVYEIVGIAESTEDRKRYLDLTTSILDNEYWT